MLKSKKCKNVRNTKYKNSFRNEKNKILTVLKGSKIFKIY